MPVLTILKYPHKILRQRAKKVKDPLDPKIQQLIKGMLKTLRSANGLGLAAPQVGHSLRLCVIDDKSNSTNQENNFYVLINPVITTYSKTQIIFQEGCLSFPDKFFSIRRPEKIKVRFLDKNGKNCKMKADGILARTIQHEIDHLNGILIIDKQKSHGK